MRVLLVEDNLDDARSILQALPASRGFTTEHAATAADAVDAVRDGGFDACLVDHRLPDVDGVGLCRRIRALGLDLPIVMVSSVRQDSIARAAFEAGADEFLVKEFDYGPRLADRLQELVGGDADAA